MVNDTGDMWFHGIHDWYGPRDLKAARGHRADHAGSERRSRRRSERASRFESVPGGGVGFGMFGPAGPGGPFMRFRIGRGPKARRGDVRSAALLLLAESPRNGYQLMQEIESRSRGLWRPSPGSMYPVLQQLEDEGLVRPEGPEGRRLLHLTDEGRAYVNDHAIELGAPWSEVADSVDENIADLRQLIVPVVVAAHQVMHAGSARQVREAQTVLAETRRRLYRILADDELTDEAPSAPGEEP